MLIILEVCDFCNRFAWTVDFRRLDGRVVRLGDYHHDQAATVREKGGGARRSCSTGVCGAFEELVSVWLFPSLVGNKCRRDPWILFLVT